MAFNVSYVFTARDKYSAIAKKVAASTGRVTRETVEAAKALKQKLVPGFDKVKVKARAAKNELSQFNKKIEETITSSDKIRNVGLALTAGLTLPLALAARSSVNLASDAEETRSKFATVFEQVSMGAENVADSFAKNFGLAGTTARQLLGDTGDLLVGFGFTEQKALDLSQQVNELAVDLASFTNFSGGAEGASAALTKALLGERESLKSLGIAISEEQVKKKIGVLLSKGATFASEQEAKAQATFAIAVDQSKKALGDYARTQNSAANLQRQLSARTIELQEGFGRLLLPIQIKITKATTKMVDALNDLSPTAKKVILVIGGIAAVAGPLLLTIAAIGFALPALATGFGAVKAAMLALAGPVGIAIALGAALVIFLAKSKKVHAFFSGIGLGIKEAIGPDLIAIMSKASSAISTMFGEGSAANDSLNGTKESLVAIADAGRLVGTIIGKVLKAIIGGLNVVGSLLGQTAGAIATLDFGQFDVGSILGANGGSPLAANTAPAISNVAPAVSTVNSNATLNGNITVSASQGSQVDSVSSETKFSGAQGNIGLGVAQ
jgi:hypothetical protein